MSAADTGYTPTTQDVRDTWEHSLIEGCASDESKADADWDSDRMAAQFDRWLALTIRAAQAEAWRKGYSAGYSTPITAFADQYANPYAGGDA